SCRPLVLGDRRMIDHTAQLLGLPQPNYDLISKPSAGRYEPNLITLIDLQNADPAHCEIGKVSANAGRAAVEYVFLGCDLALAQQTDGIGTAPLNKESMNLAGFHFAGHTELLAERCNAERISMLLASEKLRVVHVSTHVALEEAIRRVTKERVGQVIDLA